MERAVAIAALAQNPERSCFSNEPTTMVYPIMWGTWAIDLASLESVSEDSIS